MKKICFAALLILSACGGNDTDGYIEGGHHARTYKESGLAGLTGGLHHNDTVILHLETDTAHEGDSGTIGTDVVTYTYTHEVQQEICLEKHEEMPYRLTIKDEAGAVLADIADGACVTVAVKAGNYEFHLTTTAAAAGPMTFASGSGVAVFIRPYAETTHCENYKSVSPAPAPAPLADSTSLHCTADQALTCIIPPSHRELPLRNCPLRGYGPWDYSEFECTEYASSQELPYCDSYLYQNCDKLTALCSTHWKSKSYAFSDSQYRSIWTGCFTGSGTQFDDAKYKTLAKTTIDKSLQSYIDKFCSVLVKNDCTGGWKVGGAAPANCAGFVRYANSEGLQLKSGEVAVYQRTYMHVGRNTPWVEEPSVVMIVNGACNDVGRRVGPFLVGPRTQMVVYPKKGFWGKPLLVDNSGSDKPSDWYTSFDMVFASDPGDIALVDSDTASLTVVAANGKDTDDCRIKKAGVYCDGYTSTWDLRPLLTGEVVLAKEPSDIPLTAFCRPALLFNHQCSDLGKLGLKDAINRVLLPDTSTVLRMFSLAGYKGTVTVAKSESAGVAEADIDYAAVDSIRAYKLPNYNHTILVSLHKCCGCELTGVDFSNDNLSNTVLVGSKMDAAIFKNTNLTGADLRAVSLKNAVFSAVQLGNNALGCAVLDGASMVDPNNSGKSTATVSGTFDWTLSGSRNGVTVSCGGDKSSMLNAKVPIQILPTDTWKNIKLTGSTLLDTQDGYALAGIDLSERDYSGLKMGGHALDMRGADLHDASLNDANLSSIDFGPLVANDGTARYANFSGADIGGAVFANANLEGADFISVQVNASPKSLSFSYALLMNAVFRNVDLGHADFSYAYLFSKFRDTVTAQKFAEFTDVTAAGGSFVGSFLSNMTLTNAKLDDSDFQNAQLVGVTFASGSAQGSSLKNAKFGKAYLQGADLSNAMLTNASFTGAFLSLSAGYWNYNSDDPECTNIRVEYAATKLGDTSGVASCPNGASGPCDTAEKNTPKDKVIKEPPCVDGEDVDIFGNTDCISHEYLNNGQIPQCDGENEDVMQCGCLETPVENPDTDAL